MEVARIPETEAEAEESSTITRLAPLPSPQERAERLLHSLARNPELRGLYARISSGSGESGLPRPFWPV